MQAVCRAGSLHIVGTQQGPSTLIVSLGGKYKARCLVRGDLEASGDLGILSFTVATAWGSRD